MIVARGLTNRIFFSCQAHTWREWWNVWSTLALHEKEVPNITSTPETVHDKVLFHLQDCFLVSRRFYLCWLQVVIWRLDWLQVRLLLKRRRYSAVLEIRSCQENEDFPLGSKDNVSCIWQWQIVRTCPYQIWDWCPRSSIYSCESVVYLATTSQRPPLTMAFTFFPSFPFTQ